MAFDLVLRYLEVLGLASMRHAPATLNTLQVLHRAHVLQFAHDTIWISRHLVPALDPRRLASSLVRGDGGACVNLNLAFAWLLQEMGYELTVHRARVQNAFDTVMGDSLDAHIVLNVQTEVGPVLADVGLGAGLLEPAPLRDELFAQSGYTYQLAMSDDAVIGGSLALDRKLMGVRRIEWERRESTLDELTHAYYADACDPQSPYYENLTAHIRTARGSTILNGRTLTTIVDRRRRMEKIEDLGHWERVLREVFHLRLPGLADDERVHLWTKASGGSASRLGLAAAYAG